MSGGTDKSSTAIVTIDSPRFILAVDPLAALLEFAVSPFKKSADEPATTSDDHHEAAEPTEGPVSTAGSLAFRVEIVEATVIVLADDSNAKSQAIQLSIKEVLLSQQSILALKIDQLGMSFGRMDRPNDRVNFLDKLNVALSLDTRRRGSQQMTSLEMEIPDPVIFRASYTDIMLIMDIVNKASAVATKALAPEDKAKEPASPKTSFVTEGVTDGSSSALMVVPSKSSARRTSVSRRRGSTDRSRVLVSKEQVRDSERWFASAADNSTSKLKARINGFQFVLVGDLQEMPFVHLSTNEFSVMVNDWSGDVRCSTQSR